MTFEHAKAIAEQPESFSHQTLCIALKTLALEILRMKATTHCKACGHILIDGICGTCGN